jgi:2'-5' RNA ligase
MRLFVSVDLAELADGVAVVQDRLRDAEGLRFTDPEGTHVTLKFLGETDADRLPALREALATAVDDAAVGPFEVRVGGLGVFPHLEYISVVWVGVREGGGAAELTRLHEAVEERTTALGFDPADHDFTPHATVARMDHAGGKEHVQRVVRKADPDLGTVAVDEIHLTESTLGPDGPAYEPVARFPLS